MCGLQCRSRCLGLDVVGFVVMGFDSVVGLDVVSFAVVGLDVVGSILDQHFLQQLQRPQCGQ